MSTVEGPKTFITTRREWWVPTGTYDDQGACWVELMKAISAATNELRFHGTTGEPSDDSIMILPHDEHVVVRIQVESEKTEE